MAAAYRSNAFQPFPISTDNEALIAPASLEAGVQNPRVDWPVYPRRVDHNTVTGGE
jgi:hypothetical protein